MAIMQKMITQEEALNAHNYAPLPVVLTKGEGVWLEDVEGKRYLDMMSAYSAVSHGHAHPRLLKVLLAQATRLGVTSRAFYNDQLGPFLAKLCSYSGYDRALISNTGVEAVETAIKAARRWGYDVKKIEDNKAEIIVMKNNFHGRTTTVISASSEPDYKRGFGPYTPGFVQVPFGDVEAIRQAITKHTCAVLTEPMQGEGGIIIPPSGWLKSVSQLCKQQNVLLIVDEIQTGLGRTGKRFACDHDGVHPDGLILGKALGGGLLPVSAFLADDEVMNVFNPGSHGSTFGGNPLACAVALEALKIITEEKFAERSAELGDRLMKGIRSLQSPLLKEVRGKGLWIGLEVYPEKANAHEICLELMRSGILTKETHETVIRLAPPLVIKHAEIDWCIEKVSEILSEFSHR